MAGMWEVEKRNSRDKGKYNYMRAATGEGSVRSGERKSSASDMDKISSSGVERGSASGVNELKIQKEEAVRDDELLYKLQRPYFFRTPRPGDQQPLENYTESIGHDGRRRKTARMMEWASDEDLQQLAIREDDKKSIFMASSGESPVKAPLTADMKVIEKAKSKSVFRNNAAEMFSMGGKKEGAASLELEREKKWSTARLKPFVKSEKNLMLSNMLPSLTADREKEELKELQEKLASVKREKLEARKLTDSGISSQRIMETLDKLGEMEKILQLRIERLDEIIKKKDYSRRRMQQRMALAANLAGEFRFSSEDTGIKSVVTGEQQSDDENMNTSTNVDMNASENKNKETEGEAL